MTKLEELIAKLSELFELDKADLDFGIHRIIKSKHKQVREYLETRLPQQVEKHLGELAAGESASQLGDLQQEVIGSFGSDAINESGEINEAYAKTPLGEKYQLIRESSSGTQASGKVENEVYSHLLEFFSRYYEDADFMSLRRRTAGRESYAIPYNGEEVVLHWANKDQYYIKASEDLKDYTFTVQPKGKGQKRRVKFEITKLESVQNNNKVSRVFKLDTTREIYSTKDTLVIPFEFGAGSRSKAEQEAWVVGVLEKTPSEWKASLSQPDSSYSGAKAEGRTIWKKHLDTFTKKSTSDYFIHRDLEKFLKRELSFYLKNEVLHVDDVLGGNAKEVQFEMQKARAIFHVASNLIGFLGMIEEFQKKVWLKKKFIHATSWCVSLSKVPDELLPAVAKNERQLSEWKSLFPIPGFDGEISVDFLKKNSDLILETCHFDSSFTYALLASIEDIEASTTGVLIHSDNFQALNLVKKRFQNSAKCIYIDPPYNTDTSAIPYKNNYRHSSWGTLLYDRLQLLHQTLAEDGAIFVSIDKHERTILEFALDEVFGRENRVEELIWIQNTNDGRSPTYSTNHEYVEVYSKKKEKVENDFAMFREPKPGCADVSDLINRLSPTFPTVEAIENEIAVLYRQNKKRYKESVVEQGLDWDAEKKNDPWKGIYLYKFAEYRDSEGKFVPEKEAKKQGARIWVYRESDWTIMSAESKQSATISDPKHKNYRFYTPIHPTTGKPCKQPKRGWKGTQFRDPDYPKRNSLESLAEDHRIAFGDDESKVPQQKRMLHEVETNVCKSVFNDYSDGEKETAALFGKSGVFLAPKHSQFVARFVRQATRNDSLVVDCFGGSGSTAHAVLGLNRLEENSSRKFLLVEMGEYFDSILKPRVVKASFASEWQGGIPQSRDGIPQLIKVVRLESYEDALNNLTLEDQSPDLLGLPAELQDEHLIHYSLDLETKQSLFNIEAFSEPWVYKLKIYDRKNGEAKPVEVDLPETFNYLLGLKVRTMQMKEETLVIEGENPAGETLLVIWRNVEAMDNAKLETFVSKTLRINTADTEYAAIYINGDTTLNDPHKKILLTEQVFHDLMFDVEDV